MAKQLFTQETLEDGIINVLIPPFKKDGVTVTKDTPINEAIEEEGWDLFVNNLKWSVKNAGHKTKRLPGTAYTWTVSRLAQFVLTMLILFCSAVSQAQVKIGIGATRTDLNNGAISFIGEYVPQLDSLFKHQDFFYTGRHSWLTIEPTAKIRYGTEDAFSSIQVGASLLAAYFKTKTVNGYEYPDASRLMHVFPVSIGIETDLRFMNTVLDVQYKPFFQSANRPGWMRKTTFSLGATGGYKFGLKSAVDSGGKVDESLERLNSSILRLRGSFGIDAKDVVKFGGIKFSLVGNANGWYDARNGGTYYQLQGILRLALTNGSFIDFEIDKGSGAPLYNDGVEGSVRLITTLFR